MGYTAVFAPDQVTSSGRNKDSLFEFRKRNPRDMNGQGTVANHCSLRWRWSVRPRQNNVRWAIFADVIVCGYRWLPGSECLKVSLDIFNDFICSEASDKYLADAHYCSIRLSAFLIVCDPADGNFVARRLVDRRAIKLNNVPLPLSYSLKCKF